MTKEKTIVTEITPTPEASIIKFHRFLIGGLVGAITCFLPMWYFSAQWQDISKETLFEVKQQRKDMHRIEAQLIKQAALTNKHEKDNVKYEGKIEGLEFRIRALEHFHPHIKKK